MKPRQDLLAKYEAKAGTFSFADVPELDLPFDKTAKQVQDKTDCAAMVEAHDLHEDNRLHRRSDRHPQDSQPPAQARRGDYAQSIT